MENEVNRRAGQGRAWAERLATTTSAAASSRIAKLNIPSNRLGKMRQIIFMYCAGTAAISFYISFDTDTADKRRNVNLMLTLTGVLLSPPPPEEGMLKLIFLSSFLSFIHSFVSSEYQSDKQTGKKTVGIQ